MPPRPHGNPPLAAGAGAEQVQSRVDAGRRYPHAEDEQNDVGGRARARLHRSGDGGVQRPLPPAGTRRSIIAAVGMVGSGLAGSSM